MNRQRIKIKLSAFTHKILDRASKDICKSVFATGGIAKGPIPLPTDIERFTVNRSPHVNKKSREQFEIRTHSRVIFITNFTQETVEALKGLDLTSGVDVVVSVID